MNSVVEAPQSAHIFQLLYCTGKKKDLTALLGPKYLTCNAHLCDLLSKFHNLVSCTCFPVEETSIFLR